MLESAGNCIVIFQYEDINRWSRKWCRSHVTRFGLKLLPRSHPSTDHTQKVIFILDWIFGGYQGRQAEPHTRVEKKRKPRTDFLSSMFLTMVLVEDHLYLLIFPCFKLWLVCWQETRRKKTQVQASHRYSWEN